MYTKKSLFLFVSCWLLLAVISLPSGASATSGPQVADAGAGFSDTFPIMENPFAVRQAHLAYLTVKEKVGMQATIRYIASRNGSTGMLSSLLEKTGFTREGYARSYLCINGAWQDHLLYARVSGDPD